MPAISPIQVLKSRNLTDILNTPVKSLVANLRKNVLSEFITLVRKGTRLRECSAIPITS